MTEENDIIIIDGLTKIREKMEQDGDLREGEEWGPDDNYKCIPDDDLGFYQQSCQYLTSEVITRLEKLEALQDKYERIESETRTCENGHTYVIQGDVDVCPWCILEKITKGKDAKTSENKEEVHLSVNDQEQLKNKTQALIEISNLCPNCCCLSDAQAIAGGQEGISTRSGCSKCDVEDLDRQSRWLIEQSEFLIYTLQKIWKRGGKKKNDFYHIIVEEALKSINRWDK